jgi:hypothetical protein
MQHATLLSIYRWAITNEEDIKEARKYTRHIRSTSWSWEFATVQYHPLHPSEGSLMLYYDQLNVIA